MCPLSIGGMTLTTADKAGSVHDVPLLMHYGQTGLDTGKNSGKGQGPPHEKQT